MSDVLSKVYTQSTLNHDHLYYFLAWIFLQKLKGDTCCINN